VKNIKNMPWVFLVSMIILSLIMGFLCRNTLII